VDYLALVDRAASRARVVSVGRNSAWIVFDAEENARLAALPKHGEHSALVPGDVVFARLLDDGRAMVDRRLARDFTLTRTTARGRAKIMAANVDTMLVVAALSQPPPSLLMIDELLAFAELHELAAVLLFTQGDLTPLEPQASLFSLYRGLGYQTIDLNAKTGQGIDEVQAALRERRALLIGQSGVGKSTLFNALGGTATVGAVAKSGRGRQTTTTARLHRSAGGFLIDSPGIGEFEVRGIAAGEVVRGFRDLMAIPTACRFIDCIHRREPGCAVRTALDAGRIAASRYASYLAILDRGDTAAG